MVARNSKAVLDRATFTTSRLMDFCSRKELIAQTGHQPAEWPLVALKELIDNSLDACEEAGISPVITVAAGDDGITITDNGPGIPSSTIDGVMDFSVKVSSREAYVSPTRGAQGNALKTILAMPFVLSGESGRVVISANGIQHSIIFSVDQIRQQPVVEIERDNSILDSGTSVFIEWLDLACSDDGIERRFLQFADDYTWINPHMTLSTDWFGKVTTVQATAPDWKKWLPTDPTSPHWYTAERLERLIAGYVTHDDDPRTVRAFVSEFKGLSGSRKQKEVLDATGLARATLTDLVTDNTIDNNIVSSLLQAMKVATKLVKAPALGVIGKAHFEQRFEAGGVEMETFGYDKGVEMVDGIPTLIEVGFGVDKQGMSGDADVPRRLITGVNWSPGIVNPFRSLGGYGNSLNSALAEARSGADEPIVMVLHMTCPRVEYTDRGKSAVVLS